MDYHTKKILFTLVIYAVTFVCIVVIVFAMKYINQF